MTEKLARFHLYRYQLLPVNRFFQGDMYGATSIEELISRKNEFFQEALNSEGIFKKLEQIRQRKNSLSVMTLSFIELQQIGLLTMKPKTSKRK